MLRLVLVFALAVMCSQLFALSDTKTMMMLGCIKMEDKNYLDASKLFDQVDISNYDNVELWKMIYKCSLTQKKYKRAKLALLQLFMINSDNLDGWRNLYDDSYSIKDSKFTSITKIGMNYIFPDNINLHDNFLKQNYSNSDNKEKETVKVLEKRKFYWLSPPTFSSKYVINGNIANEEELLKLSNINFRADQALSARYWSNGNYEKAIEFAYLAYNAFPNREDNITSLSSMLANIGRWSESADVMKKASTFGYRDVEYAHGYLAYALGRYKDSADSFHRLRNRDILNLEYCIHEGSAAMAAGDNLQAYNALKVAAALYKDVNLDFLYISVLIKMKKYDDAMTYIKYSSDIWGNDPILKMLKINLFLRLKKYSDAADEAIKLTENVPELSGILYYCGVLGIKDNNIPVVEKCAKRLVELSGEEIDNIVLALNLYLANEMIAQAREVVGKFLSNSVFLSLKNYDTICNIAEIVSASGMWNETIMAGNELIKIDKNNAKGYIFAGGAFEQLNRMNEASRYYIKAEKLGTDEYENVKILNYYAKTGSFDDTIRIYKSRNGMNVSEDYLVILGDYKLGNGDKKGAEKCWRDAVEKYQGDMSIRAKLRLYNLSLNDSKINHALIEISKEDLKKCYTEWEAKQTTKYITALKSNNIPYNHEELVKLLNLQVITQEYSAILK